MTTKCKKYKSKRKQKSKSSFKTKCASLEAEAVRKKRKLKMREVSSLPHIPLSKKKNKHICTVWILAWFKMIQFAKCFIQKIKVKTSIIQSNKLVKTEKTVNWWVDNSKLRISSVTLLMLFLQFLHLKQTV